MECIANTEHPLRRDMGQITHGQLINRGEGLAEKDRLDPGFVRKLMREITGLHAHCMGIGSCQVRVSDNDGARMALEALKDRRKILTAEIIAIEQQKAGGLINIDAGIRPVTDVVTRFGNETGIEAASIRVRSSLVRGS